MQTDVFLHSHSTVQLSVTVSLRVFTDLWLHLDFDTIGISKSVFVLQKNGEDTRKKKTKTKSLTLRDLNRSTKEYFCMSKMGFFFVFLLRFSFYTNWLHVWKITDRGFKMKFWNHHWTFSVLRLYVGCLLVRKNILQ